MKLNTRDSDGKLASYVMNFERHILTTAHRAVGTLEDFYDRELLAWGGVWRDSEIEFDDCDLMTLFLLRWA